MPEGDTVWLTARNLRTALAGQQLVRSDFRVPALAEVDLVGQQVLDVVAAGKHLLTRLEAGTTLHSHLGMEGAWHLYRPGRRWAGGPDHQVRAVLATGSWTAVGYRLATLELMATSDEHLAVGHLGPDLLAESFDLSEAVRRLSAAAERPVGEALLDQRNLAGIGNLYRAEVLFLSGIAPWRPVADVPDLDGLVGRARRLLQANAARASQVTTGDLRPGRTTWVYRRAGQPCRRCGTAVLSAELGAGQHARVSYWCPSCQP